MRAFFCVAVLVLLNLVAVSGQNVTVCDPRVPRTVVAVVGDWSSRLVAQGLNSELTSEIIQDSLPKYLLQLAGGGVNTCAFEMVIVDSNGAGFATAVTLYRDEITVKRGLSKNSAGSNTTLVVVVQGGTRLTAALLSYVDPSVPVIAAKSADYTIADQDLYPNTVTLLPSGGQVGEALLASSIAFQWDSVAILYSSQSPYSFNMQSNLNRFFSETGAKSTVPAPVVVSTVNIPGDSFNADDAQAALSALAESNPVGVIAFVTPQQYEILSSVQVQMAKTDAVIAKFFFVLPSDCVGVLTDNALSMNTAFATKHNQISYSAVSQSFQNAMSLRSFVDISALFDALRVTWEAVGPASVATSGTAACTTPACTLAKILAVSITTGFTGPITFDSQTQARSAATSVLTFNTNMITRPVGSWSGLGGFMAIAGQLSFVPKSPLKTVTVCLLSTEACHDITNVDHMLYVFRRAVAKNSFFADNNVMINTIAMQTGFDAVSGMRHLLADANRCNFVMGPGLSAVGFALTPIINAYKIPQLDYAATSAAFSDKVKYPLFSRTVPSETPVTQVYAQIAKTFKWDRMLMITTSDENGKQIAAGVLSAMQNVNIEMEDTIYVVPNPEGAVNVNPYLVPLTKIQATAISRIVIVQLPVDFDNAKLFLQTAIDLGMHTSHVFIFGDVLCQVTDANPDLRAGFVGSLCVKPYVNATMFDHVAAHFQALADSVKIPASQMTAATQELAADRLAQNAILKAGGFTTVDQCDMGHVDMYSPYAFDAAQVVVGVIQRALGGGVNNDEYTSLTNGTGLNVLLRSTALTIGTANITSGTNVTIVDSRHFVDGALRPVTGNLSFDANGDRVGSAFVVNVQQQWPTVTVDFASWNSKTQTYLLYAEESLPFGPLRWLDNTTDVPKVTTRSITFIAAQTLQTNPGTIILSLFGFVLTMVVFGFCYRHQKAIQDEQEIDQNEEQLGGVAVPNEYPDRPENYAEEAPTFSMMQQPAAQTA